MSTWWLIPLNKWVITPVIDMGFLERVNPLKKLGSSLTHLRFVGSSPPSDLRDSIPMTGGSGLSVLVEKCQKMTGVFVDGIHGTPYIFYIAPWILWEMKVPHASTSWNFGLVCLWNWKIHSSFLSLIRFEFASKSGMSHDSTFFPQGNMIVFYKVSQQLG